MVTQAQGAPVYTESRRRPILHLWKGVLADLSALQAILKYAYQHNNPLVGRMSSELIEPPNALRIFNKVSAALASLQLAAGGR